MAFIPIIKFLKYKPKTGSDTHRMPQLHNPHKSRCVFSGIGARSVYNNATVEKMSIEKSGIVQKIDFRPYSGLFDKKDNIKREVLDLY